MVGNSAPAPYRAEVAPTSRCLLCASEGEPGSQCSVCFMPRPTLASEPAQVLGCVRCKNPMVFIEVGAGAVVHACLGCRALFVPPRGWARAFSARDVTGDLEARVGIGAGGAIASLASCPVCHRQMDRARFAATSEVVIDACSGGHGVALSSGDLGRVVDYAAHKERIGANAAAREADAVWAKANGVDPRRQAIENEEAYVRAASAARMSKYAKGGGLGLGAVILIRLFFFVLDHNHHKAKTTSMGPRVEAAGSQGAADLR